MSASAYKLHAVEKVLLHWPQLPRLLSDRPRSERLDTDALVASGDCLITLATILDDVPRLAATDTRVIQPQLERVVETLLYLQRHYKLVRKPAEHRQ